MTPTANDIERIVREVLSEMGLAKPEPGLAKPEPAQGQAPPQPSVSPASAEPVPAAGDGQLLVDAAVVTLAHLPERLDRVRQVVVPPRAVVTPAVRDELHRRNVTLAYRPAEKASGGNAVRLAAVSVGKFDPATLVSALRDQAIEVVPHRLDCLIRSTDWLWDQLQAGNTLGLMLTRHVAAGLCLVNRVAKMRAVSGRDATEIAAASEAVGANVLVANPRELSPFVLRQAITTFCGGGVRLCPKVFEERLG